MASETAPAGGWTQIKVYAATPELISQGTIAMDFDPAVFGEIAGVAVFSAAGDAIGYANVQGQHVDVHFSAVSGGIGQLPDIPVFTVRIAVLPGVAAGTKSSITLDATGSAWTNPQNSVYSVSVVPGGFTVGGTLSVTGITQGGGLLPSGTVVRIDGAGFDSGTTLTADGVAMSPVRFVSSQQMEFALMGAIEMTGRHFHLQNSAGEETDFFTSLPSAPDGTPAQGTNPHVIIPWRTQTTQALGFSTGMASQFIGLLNQTTEPVDVRVMNVEVAPVSSSVTTILPGGITFVTVDPEVNGVTYFVSPVPIRMIQYARISLGGQSVVNQRIVDGSPPAVTLSTLPDISWNWLIGTPAPVPQIVPINPYGTPTGFTVTVSGGDWLTVSPTQGTTPGTVTATANPASLGPGTYTASITVTPTVPASLAGFGAQASVIPVTLNVSDRPLLFVVAGSTSFSLLGGQLTPPQTATVLSNGNPTPFTVAASTSSGGPWLSVTPNIATTRATVTFAANPTGLGPGSYAGALTIEGAGNTLVVPVSFTIFPAAPPIKVPGSLPPFIREAGAPEPPGDSQSFIVQPANGSVSASTQTDTGGDWLHTQIFPTSQSASVYVSVTASSLAPGTYHGTVTITSSVNGSGTVSVTLNVIPKPTNPPTVTLSSLTITTPAGVTSDPQYITLDSPGGPAVYGVSINPQSQYFGLSTDAPLTPATFKVTGTGPVPGIYYANVTFSTSGGSVTIPATINVTASSTYPPILGAIVNAGSMRSGAIAPGEIIAVIGSGIGPAPTGLQLDSNGKVRTSLGDTQLLINGIPAPLTYASVGQLNAVVPYEVGTSGTATIQVVSNSLMSDTWEIPLAASAPAIFTLDATGLGRAAVLNNGRSVNDPSNPVLRGAILQIYATGEGVLSPPGVTGGVTGDGDVKKPILNVSVSIGGVNAPVQFAGSAPELVAGVLAVNVIVPQEVLPGPAVPVVVTIGGVSSQAAATIAVQ